MSRKINLIVVHCAATKPSMDIGADEIREWHTLPKPRGNGWADIGYHYVIRRSGKIEPGREINRAGAHAAGHNANSIGICLVGGLDERGKPSDLFPREQKDTLRRLIETLRLSFPETRVLGHRDLPGVNKACPSFDVRGWCAQVGIDPEPAE